jgi:hypothetical protein
MNGSSGFIKGLNPREIKTVLALCVEQKQEQLLRALLRKLHNARLLSTELTAIALRLACCSGQSNLALSVLKDIKSLGHHTDVDGVNAVLELLADVNDAKQILSILMEVQQGKYGNFVSDGPSYAALYGASVRQQSSHIIQEACSFLSTQHAIRRVKTDAAMFLDALNVCMLKDDLESALAVYVVYERCHKYVHREGYALLLTTYLNRIQSATASSGGDLCGNKEISHDQRINATDRRAGRSEAESKVARERAGYETPVGMQVVSKGANRKILAIVQHILDAGLDQQPLLADIVLRVLCVQHSLASKVTIGTGRHATRPSPLSSEDALGASDSSSGGSDATSRSPTASTVAWGYLQHLSQEYAHVPSTAALMALVETIVEEKDVLRATLLHQFCLEHKLLVMRELLPLSLLR